MTNCAHIALKGANNRVAPSGWRVRGGSAISLLVPLRRVEAAGGPPVITLEGDAYAVNAVAFSPDGQQLASGGDDWRVRRWDAASGRRIATLEGRHASGARSVAFSPDGRMLASAGSDGIVRLWDAPGGQPVAQLKGHTYAVNAVAFSPDGEQLASASNDRTVRLWDPASGQQTATLEGHTNAVNAVAFSHDGQQLASASDDGTVRLWDTHHSAAISLLNVAAPVAALAWGSCGIALAAHAAVVCLDVIDHAVA